MLLVETMAMPPIPVKKRRAAKLSKSGANDELTANTDSQTLNKRKPKRRPNLQRKSTRCRVETNQDRPTFFLHVSQRAQEERADHHADHRQSADERVLPFVVAG